MSLLRSAFNLSELTINVRAVGIDKVKSQLDGVNNSLRSTMTAAQRARYDLIQERNELQRTIYKYDALQRTRRMVMSTATGVGVGMAIGGAAAAIRSSMELETALTALQRTSGLTAGEWDKLRGSIRDLAAQMPIAAEETIKTAEAAAQLGIDGADNITAFTKTIVMLSQSTGISADKLATDFAKMMNVFKIGADTSEQYASVLAKLSVVSTATADDILNMTRRIGGASATMGLGAEQAMALAAATIDIGATAEVGGTAWTNFMMDMLTDTKKWADALGMGEENLKAMFKSSPADAIDAIVSRLGSMDQDSLLNAMKALDIDGARARNTMLSLSQAADKLRSHLKTAKDELAAGDTLSKQFELTSKTLNAEWERLNNATKLWIDNLNSAPNILKSIISLLADAASGFGGVKVNQKTWLEILKDRRQAVFGQLGTRDPNDPREQRLRARVRELDAQIAAEERRINPNIDRDRIKRRIAADPLVEQVNEAANEYASMFTAVSNKFIALWKDHKTRIAEIDAWAQPWLDENVASDRDAMLGAFGVENDPVLEAERLLGLRDNGVDEIAQRRMALGMDIANQLADQPEFRSQFQGVDQLWRDLQTGSMTKTKTPEQLAEEQIEKMEKAIEVAKKVAKHLEDNGIIIPVVGP